MMLGPPALAPLPHLARLPSDLGTDVLGPPVGPPHSGAVVDVTAWPCGPPCVARTATMAALAHGDSPPPLLTLFTTPPDAHPAIDAAQAVSGWRVAQVAPEAEEALHAAWYAARGSQELAGGGILIVDRTGSIRAVLPASPDDGARGVREVWDHLQASDPG